MKTLIITHALAFLLMSITAKAEETKKSDDCYALSPRDFDKIDKTYKDIQKVSPWIQYQYKGRSVSADKFNVLRQKQHNPGQDPNMDLP